MTLADAVPGTPVRVRNFDQSYDQRKWRAGTVVGYPIPAHYVGREGVVPVDLGTGGPPENFHISSLRLPREL